ncbi:MAG: hypothetical protein ACP5HQ_03385 [Thermoprotei archaeon]
MAPEEVKPSTVFLIGLSQAIDMVMTVTSASLWLTGSGLNLNVPSKLFYFLGIPWTLGLVAFGVILLVLKTVIEPLSNKLGGWGHGAVLVAGFTGAFSFMGALFNLPFNVIDVTLFSGQRVSQVLVMEATMLTLSFISTIYVDLNAWRGGGLREVAKFMTVVDLIPLTLFYSFVVTH